MGGAMRRIFLVILASCCFAALLGAEAAAARERDPVIGFDSSDLSMNAAIAKARKRLPEFLRILRSGSADSYGVKVKITDDNGTEHIWMDQIREADDQFDGTISNNPDKLTVVQRGSPYKVKKAAISDWYYVRDGLMHGAFTMRVMLPRMPPSQAERIRRKLAPE